MRIAYMLTSLGSGGAERQVISLAERMAAGDHEVALIVLRQRAEREWQTQLNVVRLDMTSSLSGILGGLNRGRTFLRSLQPDILHSHTYPAKMAARVFRALGSAPAVVSTIHNVYEGGQHRTWAYRLTYRFCLHSTAVSQAVAGRQPHSKATRYVEIGAVPRRNCSVITNGIDLEQFTPPYQQNGRARELMHAEEDFVWLAAGRAVPAKDFDNLIAALRRVPAEIPNTQLWIAGELQPERRVRIDGQFVGLERYELDGIRWLGLREHMAATGRCICSQFRMGGHAASGRRSHGDG